MNRQRAAHGVMPAGAIVACILSVYATSLAAQAAPAQAPPEPAPEKFELARLPKVPLKRQAVLPGSVQALASEAQRTNGEVRVPLTAADRRTPAAFRVVTGDGKVEVAPNDTPVVKLPARGTTVLSSTDAQKVAAESSLKVGVKTPLPWMVVDTKPQAEEPSGAVVRTARPYLALATAVRWDPESKLHIAQFQLGIDAEAGEDGKLEDPVVATLSVTCSEVRPQKVALDQIGPAGETVIRVGCDAATPKDPAKQELRVRLADAELPYKFPIPHQAGPPLLIAESTSESGFGIGSIKLTVKNAEEDQTPLHGVIRYWNAGAERLYGWSSREAIGQNVRPLLYRDISALERTQQRLVEDGHWSGELEHFTKAGRRIVVECSWTLIRDERGRVRSVLNINTDITARKNLEAQVIHAQRLESLGTLAGGVAHDFNNLLTVIRASLELTLAELPNDQFAHDVLSDAQVAANRGAELVRQLLTFSRREESKRRIVRLQPVVAEALALLRVTLPRTVRIEMQFDPDAPEVLADPTQIQQVVMNLGANAIQAMAERGGRLDLRLQRVMLEAPLPAHSTILHPGTYAQLIVADSGTGIDVATLNHIFDPFFTTKGPGEGTGLGLSVVHGIVRSHEGGITVRSAPNRGTEFALYFPAALRS